MQQRFSPFQLILFVFALLFLLILIQLGILTIAFEKLGLSFTEAYLLLCCSLLGSVINIPLFTIKADAPMQNESATLWRLLRVNYLNFVGKTIIAVNVGGCVIPVGFSLYLLANTDIKLLHVLLGIGLVSMISFISSRPIQGLGIGMPIFIAPFAAAIAALIIDPIHSAPLAYVAGTMGVIIGADLFRLKDIRKMGTPIASIGGAGTFDGIFITGIVAVLLA